MNITLPTQVLLIEDNPADVRLVEEYLKESSHRYVLHHATSLGAGIRKAKDVFMDIALLDLNVEDSTGFKTVTNFLKECPDVPVIILSGNNNEIIAMQAIKSGAQDFIVKGHFDGKMLNKAIRYSLERFKTKQKAELITKELSQSEQKYKEAQGIANFGHFEMDILSNKMIWSQELFKIFELENYSLAINYPVFLDYVHFEDREEVEHSFEDAINKGNPMKIVYRVLLDGHRTKYLSTHLKLKLEKHTSTASVIGVVQDITAQKLSERLLLEQKISEHATKDQLAIVHQFGFHIRTPMASITNLLYLLSQSHLKPEQSEFINGLITSFDDLSIMVNNLLGFYYYQNPDLSPNETEVDLGNLIQGATKLIQMKSGRKDLFEIKYTLPEDQKLITDPEKVNLILFNILEYIISKSKNTEDLKMDVNYDNIEQVGSERRAILNINIQKPTAMPAMAILQQIKEFDGSSEYNPYEIDENLGMAIAMSLAQLMKGKIQIYSQNQQGTNFSIELPVKFARKNIDQSKENLGEKKAVRILLVEDHFLNQMATKQVLLSWSNNITVDIAENGSVGLEKFRAHEYDLILMDLQMPVMNGIEAAMHIRKSSTIPIIALSASTSDREARQCADIGIDAYISKPYQPTDLQNKIKALLLEDVKERETV